MSETGRVLPKIGRAPGTLRAEYRRCGKPSCRCARGELHGPYYYHFVRRGGVLVKRYVRAADVERSRAACEQRRARERRRREVSRLSVRRLTAMSGLLRESEMQLASVIEGGSDG